MAEQNVVRTLTVRGISDGMDRVAADLNKVADAHGKAAQASVQAAQVTETSAKRQLDASRAYDRLRLSVDEAYAAQQKLSRADALGQRAIAQGRDVGEVNRVLDLYRQKVTGASAANENVAKSSGLAAYQLGNLRSQLFDIGTSLQGGASPLTVLSQQGPQVFEALAGQKGIGAGLKDAGASAAGLLKYITPTVSILGATAAAAGVAAVAYSRLASNQKEVALGIAGAGRASGTSVSQINRIADANAGNGLSAQSIREMSTEFARTGKIGAEMYGSLSRFAKDYAVLTGGDVADATKELAQAFADPVKGAAQLNEVIGGLDGRTRQLLDSLIASGDRLGAQRVMMGAFSDAVKAAAENTGLLTKVWNAIKADFSGGFDEIGKAVAMAVQGGVDLQQQLETAQKILSSSQARSWIPVIGPRDEAIAKANVDRLKEAIEAQRKLTEQGQNAAKTGAAKTVLDQIFPSIAEVNSLAKALSDLEKAAGLPGAPAGLELGIKRIKDIAAAGTLEIFNLQRAAKEAFQTAGMLPFQQNAARINNDINARIAAAPDRAKDLEQVRRDQLAAANVSAVGVPIRDANMALNEQIANLKVQRDAFMLSAGAAGEMAAKQDLVNKFVREGVTITPQLTAQIDAYAKKAGEVAAANDNLQRKQQNIIQGMDEMRSGTQSAITGIFSSIRQGQNPMQALMNSMGRMSDQLVDRLISKPLTEWGMGQFGKAGGGALGDWGSIFGSAAGITTPQATVNAGAVNVNGLGLGSGGVPGVGSITSGGGSAVGSVASVATGGAGRVSVQLGGGGAGSSAIAPAVPSVAAAMPVPSVAPSGGMTAAQAALLPMLPAKNPALTSREDATVARDLDNYGGWAGSGPSKALMDRMALPMAEKAREMATASDQAAASLGKLNGAGSQAADTLEKIGGRLGASPTGSSGINFGGGGGGSSFDYSTAQTDYTSGFEGLTFNANGNVLTPRGPMALRMMAGGGIARAGQPVMNIIGEGRMNEAVIPLPDGRSVPVSMKVPMPANGNGGGGGIIVNQAPINVNAAQGYTPEQIAAAIQQANAETVKHIQRNFGGMSRQWDRRAG